MHAPRSREARSPRRCRGDAEYPSFALSGFRAKQLQRFLLKAFIFKGSGMVMTKAISIDSLVPKKSAYLSNQISGPVGSVTKRRAGGRRNRVRVDDRRAGSMMNSATGGANGLPALPPRNGVRGGRRRDRPRTNRRTAGQHNEPASTTADVESGEKEAKEINLEEMHDKARTYFSLMADDVNGPIYNGGAVPGHGHGAPGANKGPTIPDVVTRFQAVTKVPRSASSSPNPPRCRSSSPPRVRCESSSSRRRTGAGRRRHDPRRRPDGERTGATSSSEREATRGRSPVRWWRLAMRWRCSRGAHVDAGQRPAPAGAQRV